MRPGGARAKTCTTPLGAAPGTILVGQQASKDRGGETQGCSLRAPENAVLFAEVTPRAVTCQRV
jgi:hypothetical protein